MLCVLLFLVSGVLCDDFLSSWTKNYVNLHCRDHYNTPVDWWILYKPPKGDGATWKSGQNFTFVTSLHTGMWRLAEEPITSSFMLEKTFSPLFRPTSRKAQAILSYHSEGSDGARNITSPLMFADEIGGLFISHTVPGLLDMTSENHMSFPESEIDNGHLIMCFSLDLWALNAIGKALNEIGYTVSALRVSTPFRRVLPDWPSGSSTMNIDSLKTLLNMVEFSTIERTLTPSLVFRRPGDGRCLFRGFAKNKKIILDVYGHDRRTKPVCEQAYGVRNIESISLKLFTMSSDILYIKKQSDRIGFAVSTAAQWQRTGETKEKYWTCFGATEEDHNSEEGKFIICIEDYRIWRGFDTMKVKEPEC